MPEPETNQPTILVVEDDPSLVRSLQSILTASGYKVRAAESGSEARAMLDEVQPRLILLDLTLPDTDGLVLAATLKTLTSIPVIIMSARTEQTARVLGLKLGADDFVAKPFDVEELLARVEAVLRRSAHVPHPKTSDPADRIRIGALTITPSRGLVTLGTEPIHLTATEYWLLNALARHVNDVLSREALLQLVWGYQDSGARHLVDVAIGRLRTKLRRCRLPAPPIVTVRGAGFKLLFEAEPTRETDPAAGADVRPRTAQPSS